MTLAAFFGIFLFLMLILADWMQFSRVTAAASRYGCLVSRREEHLPGVTEEALQARFDAQGWLHLPHGVARHFPDDRLILLRPHYRRFSQFRSAWPMKSALQWRPDPQGLIVASMRHMPWSSTILTGLWFAVVGVGSLGFLGSYLWNGGLASLGGVIMGLGVTALGLIVLVFGLATVVAAYRLEEQRLSTVYQEWKQAITSDRRLAESGVPPANPQQILASPDQR